MNKVLGIFRGFPGLGRVVAGVSLLESLYNEYGYEIKMISYLQGDKYLVSKGYVSFGTVSQHDYCSLGLVPTYSLGLSIFDCIAHFSPDVIVIDGEPLMIQAIRMYYPNMKIAVLLNPSDVENSANNPVAMKYIVSSYALSDLAIVHGLRKINSRNDFNKIISISTIIRRELLNITRKPSNNIYCVLGGGTVNVGEEFEESTIQLARLSIDAMSELKEYNLTVVCSSVNIFNRLKGLIISNNVHIMPELIDAEVFFSNACFIITRCGRNSLSELMYLNIPFAAYVSGDKYRKDEQENNIKNLGAAKMVVITPETSSHELSMAIRKELASCCNAVQFKSGNSEALKAIIDLTEKQ